MDFLILYKYKVSNNFGYEILYLVLFDMTCEVV